MSPGFAVPTVIGCCSGNQSHHSVSDCDPCEQLDCNRSGRPRSTPARSTSRRRRRPTLRGTSSRSHNRPSAPSTSPTRLVPPSTTATRTRPSSGSIETQSPLLSRRRRRPRSYAPTYAKTRNPCDCEDEVADGPKTIETRNTPAEQFLQASFEERQRHVREVGRIRQRSAP